MTTDKIILIAGVLAILAADHFTEKRYKEIKGPGRDALFEELAKLKFPTGLFLVAIVVDIIRSRVIGASGPLALLVAPAVGMAAGLLAFAIRLRAVSAYAAKGDAAQAKKLRMAAVVTVVVSIAFWTAIALYRVSA